MKKLIILVLSITVLLGLSLGVAAEDHYEAIKVDEELAVGTEWPVEDENVIELDKDENDEATGKVWLFWDDENIYAQFDVHTEYPLSNAQTGHDIWNGDAIELSLALDPLPDDDEVAKWIVAKTDKAGYQIVTRDPRTEMERCEGIDVEMLETDFGFRAQIIFAQDHEIMSNFKVSENPEQLIGFQVGLSEDTDERANMLYDVQADGVNEPHRFTELHFVE